MRKEFKIGFLIYILIDHYYVFASISFFLAYKKVHMKEYFMSDSTPFDSMQKFMPTLFYFPHLGGASRHHLGEGRRHGWE